MKRKSSIFMAVLVTVALCGSVVSGQEVQNLYNSTDTPQELLELGTTASTLVIADFGFVTDLRVKLDITHESVDQLEAYLIGPDGTRIQLFTGIGASGSDLSGTCFLDYAEMSLSEGEAPFVGTYRSERLADFHFKNIEGAWTLEIKDNTPEVSGTLNSWELAIRTISSNLYLEETFPSTTISSLWPDIDGATVNGVGTNNPSEPYSLRLNGDPSGGDSVTSMGINLTGCLGATLIYSYERTSPGYSGGESPDKGEDLVIEGLSNSGWVEIDRQLGEEPDMTSFVQVSVPLPAEVLQRVFRLRIRRAAGTVGDYDDWFVDDVKIVLNGLESPGIVSNPSFEGQTWGWTTTQAFSSSLWQSDGSCSARVFTIPQITHEAGAWVGLAQSIDLSNIVAIKFDASTVAGSGGTWEKCVASVYIDDTEVWSDAGADKTWLDVQVDTSEYTAVHTLSLGLSFLETGNFDEDVHFDNIRTYLGD